VSCSKLRRRLKAAQALADTDERKPRTVRPTAKEIAAMELAIALDMRYVAKRLGMGVIPARYEWLRGLGMISAGLIARGAPVF
jgi:hypothetical protein